MKSTKLEELILEKNDKVFLGKLFKMYDLSQVSEITYLKNINMIDQLSEKKRKIVIARLNFIKSNRTHLPIITVFLTLLFASINYLALAISGEVVDYFINTWNIGLTDGEIKLTEYSTIILFNCLGILFFIKRYDNDLKAVSLTTYLLELFK